MTHPLVITARAQLGKPYKHLARGPSRFDCVGLVAYCLTVHGFPVHDVPLYGREPRKQDMRTAIEANLGAPFRGDWEPGDIAIVSLNKQPNHLAILADYVFGGLSLIHCFSEPGIAHGVVEHGINPEWRSHIRAVYRVELTA